MRLTGLALLMMVATLLGAAAPAHAQDGILESIDEILGTASDYLDDNLLFGKFRFSPTSDALVSCGSDLCLSAVLRFCTSSFSCGSAAPTSEALALCSSGFM